MPSASSVPLRLAAFAAVLAAVFGVALLAGRAVDADPPADAAAAADAGHGAMPAAAVRGLAVAQDGLRLVVADPEVRRDRPERLRFRIVDDRGAAVRAFDVEHTRRMHLILARRDLTGFAHLHPRMAADGTWTTDVRLPEAGSYRLFADFSHDGTRTTLASDLRVDGPAELQPLPAPRNVAIAGDLEVRLDAGAVHPGAEADLRFSVREDGRPLRPEPYLGARGHLVALREGDLAFLHVHPTDGAGDAIAFGATFPTAGAYRLFLQVRVRGAVRTVPFTLEVR